MKNLTDEQINSELKRVAEEQRKKEQEQRSAFSEYCALRDERKRRTKLQLATLSDAELAENLSSQKSQGYHQDWELRTLIQNEITQRKKARKARLRKEAKKPLGEETTDQLVEMARDTDGLSEPQVDALLKELTERSRPMLQALEHLKEVRKRMRDVKDVVDPPLRVITST